MPAVVVIGSINVDLVAFAERLPKRGETINGTGFEQFPGGKGANQAAAAARAGARTFMVGAVGANPFGDFMRATLAGLNVDIAGVETVDAPTGVALITVGGGDNQIVVVPGANHRIDPGRIERYGFARGDVCVTQLETKSDLVRAVLISARRQGAIALFNPAPAEIEARSSLPLADVIVVNETETALLAGEAFAWNAPEDSVRRAARALGLRRDQVLVVTLGEDGVVALEGDGTIRIPGRPIVAVDSTGAGDCFVGYLAAALCRGDALAPALREANAAASLSVTGKGALVSFPDRARVLRLG